MFTINDVTQLLEKVKLFVLASKTLSPVLVLLFHVVVMINAYSNF